MSTIQIKRERRGDTDVIEYVGPIDANAGIHLVPLLEGAAKKVVFKLGQVSSINSLGTGVLTNFLRTFRDGRELAFEDCSPPIVGLINMIPSVTQGVRIHSIQVPYHCDPCDVSLVKPVAFGATPLPIASFEGAVRCPKCRDPMVLEESADGYFHFAVTKGLVSA